MLFAATDAKSGVPSFLKKVVEVLLGGSVAVAAAWWGLKTTTPDWYPKALASSEFFKWDTVATGFLASVTSFFVLVAFHVFLPLLVYIPHAVSMRLMGIKQATVEAGNVGKILLNLKAEHLAECAGGKTVPPIRVICISGKNLFQNQENGGAPLFDVAKTGALRVLMPKTNAGNPTLVARYDSYSPEFKQSNYQELGSLVDEVRKSKTFLRTYRNEVIEHNALCMWRVVLFSGCCVVQNYFPNHSGMQSDNSPVFVFEKSEKDDGTNFSYYETFDRIFELLAKRPGS